MSPKQSIWFRLGYALERTKKSPPTTAKRLRSLADRNRPKSASAARTDTAVPTLDDLLASGASAAVARVLGAWTPRGKTGIAKLVRAGAAGAAAAILVDMVRPLVRGVLEAPIDETTADRILAGIGQGLVYGAVVEPRVPGPALLKGVLYGSAEYAVDPMGGLARVLGPLSPHRRLPIVGHLLEELDPHDRAYVEHVVFGVAMAVLYGSSRSSNGIRLDDEDE